MLAKCCLNSGEPNVAVAKKVKAYIEIPIAKNVINNHNISFTLSIIIVVFC